MRQLSSPSTRRRRPAIRRLAPALVALLVSACGGGSGGSADSSVPDSGNSLRGARAAPWSATAAPDPQAAQSRREYIAALPGFVALWDMNTRDPDTGWFVALTPKGGRDYKLHPKAFSPQFVGEAYAAFGTELEDRVSMADFPQLATGVFGNAVYFDTDTTQGRALQVPREEFHDTRLDIKGDKSFTIVAWVKRAPGAYSHGMAGIWAERNLYDQFVRKPADASDARQFALFGGHPTHDSDFVSLHVSNTGGATFEGSWAKDIAFSSLKAPGNNLWDKDANLAGLGNGDWHTYAATYDRATGEVTTYVDGQFTPRWEVMHKYDAVKNAWTIDEGAYGTGTGGYFHDQRRAWEAKRDGYPLEGTDGKRPKREDPWLNNEKFPVYHYDPDGNARATTDAELAAVHGKAEPTVRSVTVERIDPATNAKSVKVVGQEYTYAHTKVVEYTDPITGDVKRFLSALKVNPYWFGQDIYSPASRDRGAPFILGSPIISHGTNRGSSGMSGWMSGAAVFDTALSQADLLALHTRTAQSLTSSSAKQTLTPLQTLHLVSVDALAVALRREAMDRFRKCKASADCKVDSADSLLMTTGSDTNETTKQKSANAVIRAERLSYGYPAVGETPKEDTLVNEVGNPVPRRRLDQSFGVRDLAKEDFTLVQDAVNGNAMEFRRKGAAKPETCAVRYEVPTGAGRVPTITKSVSGCAPDAVIPDALNRALEPVAQPNDVEPSITTQPQAQAVRAGVPVTLTVAVKAGGTEPYRYQWLRNGTPIPGATSATYSFTPSRADDGLRFSVRVRNIAGSVTSEDARLAVSNPPSPSPDPQLAALMALKSRLDNVATELHAKCVSPGCDPNGFGSGAMVNHNGQPVSLTYGWPDAGDNRSGQIKDLVDHTGFTAVDASNAYTDFRLDSAYQPTSCYVRYYDAWYGNPGKVNRQYYVETVSGGCSAPPPPAVAGSAAPGSAAATTLQTALLAKAQELRRLCAVPGSGCDVANFGTVYDGSVGVGMVFGWPDAGDGRSGQIKDVVPHAGFEASDGGGGAYTEFRFSAARDPLGCKVTYFDAWFDNPAKNKPKGDILVEASTSGC